MNVACVKAWRFLIKLFLGIKKLRNILTGVKKRVTPMRLEIAQDTWDQAEEGILSLIPRYSSEVHGDARRACLNSAVYASQDACGQLVLYVARAQTTIVGFLAALVLPHHQYVPSVWGFIDLWYVLPRFRRKGATSCRFGWDFLHRRSIPRWQTG